jgi:hypothetical protein
MLAALNTLVRVTATRPGSTRVMALDRHLRAGPGARAGAGLIRGAGVSAAIIVVRA